LLREDDEESKYEAEFGYLNIYDGSIGSCENTPIEIELICRDIVAEKEKHWCSFCEDQHKYGEIGYDPETDDERFRRVMKESETKQPETEAAKDIKAFLLERRGEDFPYRNHAYVCEESEK